MVYAQFAASELSRRLVTSDGKSRPPDRRKDVAPLPIQTCGAPSMSSGLPH